MLGASLSHIHVLRGQQITDMGLPSRFGKSQRTFVFWRNSNFSEISMYVMWRNLMYICGQDLVSFPNPLALESEAENLSRQDQSIKFEKGAVLFKTITAQNRQVLTSSQSSEMQ